MALAPRLEWIQTTSSGVGKAVHDLGLAESDLLITTARGVHAEPLAEFGLPRGDGSFVFRDLSYRFWAVGLDDYVAHLR